MMNLPNMISLFRVILIIPCLFYFNAGQNYLGLSILILMIITDFADGIIARKYKNVSDFGNAIDPICDKIVIIALFMYLVFNKDFPLWFFIILISRDIVLLYLGVLIKRQSGNMPQANVPGKIMMNTIALLVIGLFMDLDILAQFGLLSSVVFFVYSTVVYLSDYKKILLKA